MKKRELQRETPRKKGPVKRNEEKGAAKRVTKKIRPLKRDVRKKGHVKRDIKKKGPVKRDIKKQDL